MNWPESKSQTQTSVEIWEALEAMIKDILCPTQSSHIIVINYSKKYNYNIIPICIQGDAHLLSQVSDT